MDNEFLPADRPGAPNESFPAEEVPASQALSKRAARRLIQRAFVLVGRDRNVRQHIREASVVTLWTLEDWKLGWTVELERGKVHFERRPAKHPDLTLTWRTAEEFFNQIENGVPPDDGLGIAGNLHLRRFSQPVYQAFCKALRKVLRYPFDDEGNRLT